MTYSSQEQAYLTFLRAVPTVAAVEGLSYADTLEPERTCSLCDGLGHGYPGAGPCPLEELGYDVDLEYEDRLVFGMGY